MKKKPYATVRALERGLDLMVALSKIGRAKAAELAQATNLDRTTVYRILETLRRKGYVSFREDDRTFRLTIAVRQLSEGFTDLDYTCSIVAPELNHFLERVMWPSDFASFEMGSMLIRETTHRLSPFSIHRSMIGKTRPLTRSALGKAVLCAASDTERNLMLNLAVETDQPDADYAQSDAYIDTIRADYAKRGYAWSVDGTETGISAIALPIRSKSYVIGAINIIFFTKTMKPEEAAKQYLKDLRSAANAIENRLNTKN